MLRFVCLLFIFFFGVIDAVPVDLFSLTNTVDVVSEHEMVNLDHSIIATNESCYQSLSMPNTIDSLAYLIEQMLIEKSFDRADKIVMDGYFRLTVFADIEYYFALGIEAARQNYKELMRLILEEHLNLSDALSYATSLCLTASERGNLDTLNVILNFMSQSNANYDPYYESAMRLAQLHGHVAVMERLLLHSHWSLSRRSSLIHELPVSIEFQSAFLSLLSIQ